MINAMQKMLYSIGTIKFNCLAHWTLVEIILTELYLSLSLKIVNFKLHKNSQFQITLDIVGICGVWFVFDPKYEPT